MALKSKNGHSTAWGPIVFSRNLKELYAPQKIKRFSPTPGGIDNLSLSSTDTFSIPGRGEFKVDFNGYFRVARDNPTTSDWKTSEVYVNMVGIKLIGTSKQLGKITVNLNPNIISAGQVMPTTGAASVKACRIAAGVTFSLPSMGMTVFNKEPILLMNNGIKSVPPVEDPNGAAHIYKLPLYDMKNPNGKPVVYLTSLRYTVGNYITKARARSLDKMK